MIVSSFITLNEKCLFYFYLYLNIALLWALIMLLLPFCFYFCFCSCVSVCSVGCLLNLKYFLHFWQLAYTNNLSNNMLLASTSQTVREDPPYSPFPDTQSVPKYSNVASSITGPSMAMPEVRSFAINSYPQFTILLRDWIPVA